jgi:hypothetical protein
MILRHTVSRARPNRTPPPDTKSISAFVRFRIAFATTLHSNRSIYWESYIATNPINRTDRFRGKVFPDRHTDCKLQFQTLPVASIARQDSQNLLALSPGALLALVVFLLCLVPEWALVLALYRQKFAQLLCVKAT